MNNFSVFLIPLIVLIIIIYGYKKRINIYDSFLIGAKEGLITTFNIFPTIIAMIFAINIFLRSDFLIFALGWAENFLFQFNLPLNILPMALLRPISSSASMAILNDILSNTGPDSFAGRLASTIQGCTDTTFYVLAIYFGSVRIKKTGYSLTVSLAADLVSIITAVIVTAVFFL